MQLRKGNGKGAPSEGLWGGHHACWSMATLVITLPPVCPHTQALEGSPKLSLVLQGKLWWNRAWWSLSLEENSIS